MTQLQTERLADWNKAQKLLKNGLTQGAAAKKVGVSVATLQNWKKKFSSKTFKKKVYKKRNKVTITEIPPLSDHISVFVTKGGVEIRVGQ